MVRISGVIVARDEAHQIRYALGSLMGWCDEVIVVDQESDDETAVIARELGARVLSHPRSGRPSLGRPAGWEAASGEFIMVLDADEVVHPRLAARLRWLAEQPGGPDVVQVPRLNVELGTWIQHGSNWPSRKARFFRAGHVRYRERIHQGLQVQPGSRVLKLPAERELAIWHFSYRDVSSLVDKVNHYTTIEARQAVERGARPVRRPVDLLRGPTRYLWRQYLRGGGHRDGMTGLIMAMTRAYYHFLIAAKRWDEPRRMDRIAAFDRIREELLAGFEARSDGTVDAPDHADAQRDREPAQLRGSSPAATPRHPRA